MACKCKFKYASIGDIATPEEALNIFKLQIGQCLPLMGLVKEEDKENLWKFWRTVSAAVKIALNGRGDILQTSKHLAKRSASNTDVELEDPILRLDRNVISIYMPLKVLNNKVVKFRVMKFSEGKKVGDLLEEIQVKNTSFFSDSEKTSNGQQTDSGSNLVSSERDQKKTGVKSDIIDSSDEGLQAVVKYLQEICNNKNFSQSASETVMQKDGGIGLALNNMINHQRASKKSWPISRPTTRSLTSIHGNKDANNSKSLINFTSVNSRSNLPHGDSEASSENSSFYQDLHSEIYRQELESKILTPKSSGEGQIQRLTTQNPICKLQATHSMIFRTSSENVSSEPMQTCNISNIATIMQPRSASDIETIISALEEELKKSGKDPSSISLAPPAKIMHISDAEAQQEHSTDNSHLDVLGGTEQTQITSPSNFKAASRQMEVVDCDETEVSELSPEGLGVNNAISAQADCKNIKSTQAESTNHQASSNDMFDQMITYIDESGQQIKVQASTVQIAAYINDNGQVDHTESSHDPSYVDDSGQHVQIVQGQEVLEVDGGIEGVVWACDNEVQILQNQQQQQQIVNHGHPDGSEQHGMESYECSKAVFLESQPVQAHYDVVEYEVLSDKHIKRGRKKRVKADVDKTEDGGTISTSDPQNFDTLDRTCPICHRILNYASSMKAHMRIHTGARPFSCGQCDRKFTTKANRDRHEATHVGLKPFKCEECHKSFTEKRSLKIHMRSHTGERPFVCDTCGQGFAQKCTLQVHMVLHTERRAHLCDLCGKAFRQKNQLDVHVKRHNRQAGYPCQHCPTQCYTKGDLMRHMIKHTGERPYRCQLCPRAFTRKQYLSDHENQHYDRKPYSCSECGAAFHDMGSCHRHLRKHREKSKDQTAAPESDNHNMSLLTSQILSNAKEGQILKLQDGTAAMVKQVTNEADGSTVYHITRLTLPNNISSLDTNISASLQEHHGEHITSEVKME